MYHDRDAYMVYNMYPKPYTRSISWYTRREDNTIIILVYSYLAKTRNVMYRTYRIVINYYEL